MWDVLEVSRLSDILLELFTFSENDGSQSRIFESSLEIYDHHVKSSLPKILNKTQLSLVQFLGKVLERSEMEGDKVGSISFSEQFAELKSSTNFLDQDGNIMKVFSCDFELSVGRLLNNAVLLWDIVELIVEVSLETVLNLERRGHLVLGWNWDQLHFFLIILDDRNSVTLEVIVVEIRKREIVDGKFFRSNVIILQERGNGLFILGIVEWFEKLLVGFVGFKVDLFLSRDHRVTVFLIGSFHDNHVVHLSWLEDISSFILGDEFLWRSFFDIKW